MTMNRIAFVLILIHSVNILFSQEVNDVKVQLIPQSPKNWDTTCYTTYSHKLNVYFGTSRLDYHLDISSTFKHPYKYSTGINYATFTPVNYSFGFSYDKIGLSFGFSKKYDYDSTQSKPKSKYMAYNFSFGGNKFIIEPYIVRFTGFYDSNTPNNDTLYKKNKRYHADPSLQIFSAKVNGIYFFNNKQFAYRTMSGFTNRQLQSKGSWMAVANFYINKMRSDSIVYPKSVELAYDTVKKLNRFNIWGVNLGGGYGHIFAIGKKKRFFVGFTAAVMLGYQNKQVFFKDSISVKQEKTGYASDIRFSMGWTTDKFFAVIYGSADRVMMNYEKVKFTMYAVPINFIIGWRFSIKPPKPYRWFMNTKVYKWM